MSINYNQRDTVDYMDVGQYATFLNFKVII